MCALCGGENKLQGLTVLLFLPLAPLMCGYVSILLCGQMRLRQMVSSCCVGINGPLLEPTISVQICLTHNKIAPLHHIEVCWIIIIIFLSFPVLLARREGFWILKWKHCVPFFKFFTVLTLFLFFFCPFCPFLGKVCWIPSVCQYVCVCGCVFFLPLCSWPQCNTPFTVYRRLMASVSFLLFAS